MHISGLFVYPVKSLRGYAVDAMDFDTHGFVHDRRFLVVDATGKFLTQRAHPRMARIATHLTSDRLTLSADGAGSISVSSASDPSAPLRAVNVWKSEGLQAEECGDDAAAWLSAFLSSPCRLVRLGAAYHRPVLKSAARPGDVVSFADAAPFLLIGEASLAHLNDRIQENGGEAVPMDRFRTNITVAGSAPFAEDDWARVRIGAFLFRNGGLCARCIMTTTDQATGERGKEPLKTLATFRRDRVDPTDLNFGVNLIHETKTGTLRVGDELTPLPASP